MSDEEKTEEEGQTIKEQVNEILEDVRETLADGREALKKVDEIGDSVAPIVEKIAPVLEGAVNIAVPGAGVAMKGIREGAKGAVKGILGATASDTWASEKREDEDGWIRVSAEANEKLNMLILTSYLKVQGGLLYRVLTSKADGSGAPTIVLTFVPASEILAVNPLHSVGVDDERETSGANLEPADPKSDDYR